MTVVRQMNLRPGFVGLGKMGRPIAANLTRSFPAALLFDAAGTSDRLPENGVAAADVCQIAREATHVFLSLPNKTAVREVVRELIAAHGPELRVVIDLSTIGVETAREAGQALSLIGVSYLDAPVSGGTEGARAGTITVMCAGDRGAYDESQPLLKSLATRIFHVGDLPGQGQALKLLNNFLAATTLAATSEAVYFGLREGLELRAMLEVLNVSSGQSAATSDKFVKHVATGTYSAGFSNTLMLKDVDLFVESAGAAHVLGPIGTLILEIWKRFAACKPGVDFTRVHEFVQSELRADGGP
jgi:3-hydroxyisobutyrate dehydrogenase